MSNDAAQQQTRQRHARQTEQLAQRTGEHNAVGAQHQGLVDQLRQGTTIFRPVVRATERTPEIVDKHRHLQCQRHHEQQTHPQGRHQLPTIP